MTAPPRVVCAPNAFKGSLTAAEAASAMSEGVTQAGGEPVLLPVADGGDGTLDVLLSDAAPRARVSRVAVTGPLGEPVAARLGHIDRTAVVELAEASGLRLISGRLHPMRATSRGLGELIAAALDEEPERILVGVGGSACTDGGAGMLQALGARLLDGDGREIGAGGGALRRLARIDMGEMHPALEHVRIDVASDVRNPLLGPNGAAYVFAPQKGATAEDVQRLEEGLARLAAVAERDSASGRYASLPGAGAAGGCGFALALIGAHLYPGAALVCDVIGLDALLHGAALVLTGEGQLDQQTASGKAPAEVATRAARAGLRCVAIAGEVIDPMGSLFTGAISLVEIAGELDPFLHAHALVRGAAYRAVELFLPRR
ncbi:MAG: glycerate kinase [Candidatus Dormibacteria bacterium]